MSSTEAKIIREHNKAYIRDCIFKDVSAENGGAVSFNDAIFSLFISSVTFRNCRSKVSGGAIFARAKFVDIKNTFAISCFAPSSAFMDVVAERHVTAKNLTVRECQATEGNIISINGIAKFKKCTFTDNKGAENIISATTADFSNIQFKNNNVKEGKSLLSFDVFDIKNCQIHVDKNQYVIDSRSKGIFKNSVFDGRAENVAKFNSGIKLSNCNFLKTPISERKLKDVKNEKVPEAEALADEQPPTPLPEPTKNDLKQASIAGCAIGSLILLIVFILLITKCVPTASDYTPQHFDYYEEEDEDSQIVSRNLELNQEEEENPIDYHFTTNDPEKQDIQPKRKVIIIPELNSDEEF
jgi:hypothetical protein